MIADLKERGASTVTPFVIVNFSHHKHLHLPKDQVVAFAETDCKQRRNARNLHHGTTRKRATQELDTRKKMAEKVQ